MIRVTQLKLTLDDDISLLEEKIIKKLKLNKNEIFTYKIHKKNIDARKKDCIYFVYSVDVDIENENKILSKKLKDVSVVEKIKYSVYKGENRMAKQPIVVGFGPSGMFAALLLAQNGYRPIVLERGEEMAKRKQSVETFYKHAILNEESNIQYGEGGAGTFSDGKLTARSKDIRVQKVYETFVEFGAPEEILYDSFPHVGSDKLEVIITNIRKKIIELGGEVHFSCRVDELIVENNQIKGVICGNQKYESDHVILAIGNSARDLVYTLHKQSVAMEAKPLAIGVRIEHKQEWVNKALYHDFYNHPSLSAASYRLTYQGKDKRGVYTFCMCPGGEVVCATSLKEHVVVNGMSNYARDKENANSAILVQVDNRHYGDGLFDGIKFIDELEKKAFILGGNNYQAPAQLVKDFLGNKKSTEILSVKPSYAIGVNMCDLHDLFPEDVCELLKEAILDFNKKMNGFAMDDAILSGIETRSSSPIRIIRDKETLESISYAGLYPSGEGAGYAGGIISSAIDGLKCAEKLIEKDRRGIE